MSLFGGIQSLTAIACNHIELEDYEEAAEIFSSLVSGLCSYALSPTPIGGTDNDNARSQSKIDVSSVEDEMVNRTSAVFPHPFTLQYEI